MNRRQILFKSLAFIFLSSNSLKKISISISILLIGYQKNSNEIYVDSFGAIGNGVADDTLALQNAFDHAHKHKSKVINFSENRNYRITKTINIVSNIIIEGKSSSIILDKKFHDKNFRHYPIFLSSFKRNIIIRNIVFICYSSIAYGIIIRSSSNVKIVSSKAIGASLLYSGASLNLQYKDISSLNMCHNILVLNCYGLAYKDLSSNDLSLDGCVHFTYTDGFSAIKNHISGYRHGISWWGGDAHHLRDGALSNQRKCVSGLIEKNNLNNIKGGGIWGSMGQKINIISNNISNCGDVGIDSEGSFSIFIHNNVVKNCTNGCITTFYFNKSISIFENVVSSDIPGQYLFKIYNAAQTFDNKNITVKKNVFTYRGKEGNAFLGGDNCETLIVNENEFFNTAISLTGNNNRYITIANNIIEFNRPIQNSLGFISVGNTHSNGSLYLIKNEIRMLSQIKTKITVLYIPQSDYNSSANTFIQGNTISEFTNIFSLLNMSPNSEIVHRFYIENNLIDQSCFASTKTLDNSYSNNCNILSRNKKEKIYLLWKNNKFPDGKIIPID
ncbi:MAG: glycoside hydrolase family 55 protein [Thermosynechococcaceae cyanobacterium MS004]|nr:glycoside hydrolase family 55 protein [Thermosynechococcaceae cyanobacterium MS004]